MLGVGRPFLVGSHARVAPVVREAEWARGAAPSVAHVPMPTRAKLAEAWTRTGQMEHASVAAFARFALELVALGAPADLLRWTQRAMSEEIDHAERAFMLASAYRGGPVGPGPLDVEGALRAPTAESVLATLLREGCIGETLAAVEAAEALQHATDPVVRATLDIILRDETSHAALAWTAARWLLERRGDLRPWFAAELTRAVAERVAAPKTSGLDDPGLAQHGILDAVRQREIHAAALSRIVLPNAAALLGRVAAA
jgi:hypothetical protein